MYQRDGKAAYKADLSNTILLMDELGNPEEGLKCIHVAGTNGKGSTSHMLASILQHAGYKVGLYTSPHLKDFRERIKINGEMIPQDHVVEFVRDHKQFFELNALSFFEMTVGMALDYFRKKAVDIAVIEVGMGGRLDSTNVVTPEVSVITNIGLDHTAFLGTTLEEIAVEKAGIIKQGVPVVIGEIQEETSYVFQQIAEQQLAPITFAENVTQGRFETDLLGVYQQKNMQTALTTIDVLVKTGLEVSEESIRDGLVSVVSTTGLLGRWQILGEAPRIICDTAHNKEGLELVLGQLKKQVFEQLFVVLGMVNDKDLDRVLPLFPKNAEYFFCKPDIPRGMDTEQLKTEALRHGLHGEVYKSVIHAFEAAKAKAGERDLIFIGGSTFTVAEVL
ncbi:folylpolyglutamate synthase/dihydrofolate synthase family protein [Aureitalea sp. L0-47]|uniref:bifunctional folylpolyglutamate synthase/dihydrofolate synthase n=1 Tax=Aureitalea sp. L0-47 TaxID=2816962 RepID=UPI002AA2A3DF|nr:folylpolyglutamate synthase/dihydrofolate synthase family protein [Aureitalea sp. L0-47]